MQRVERGLPGLPGLLGGFPEFPEFPEFPGLPGSRASRGLPRLPGGFPGASRASRASRGCQASRVSPPYGGSEHLKQGVDTIQRQSLDFVCYCHPHRKQGANISGEQSNTGATKKLEKPVRHAAGTGFRSAAAGTLDGDHDR